MPFGKLIARENKHITVPPPDRPELPYKEFRANRADPIFNEFDPPKQTRTIFKTLNISLAVAGSQNLQLSGNGIAYISSTNATDIVNVQWNADSDPVPFHAGNNILNAPFGPGDITLSWSAIAGATAVIVIINVDADNNLRVQ